MGQVLKIRQLTTFAEILIVVLGITAILTILYFTIPSTPTSTSNEVNSSDSLKTKETLVAPLVKATDSIPLKNSIEKDVIPQKVNTNLKKEESVHVKHSTKKKIDKVVSKPTNKNIKKVPSDRENLNVTF